MILVTGATGFIGYRLVHALASAGHPVKVMLRPSRRSPRMPTGLPVSVALADMRDARGVRAAMVGVKKIVHLASAERRPPRTRVLSEDVAGARNIVDAALDVGVDRIIYLSHLGAERNSAYPLLRAKALSEGEIKGAGHRTTIIRSGIAFGPDDHFTTSLAKIMGAMPGFVPLPAQGQVLLQPIWVEDLIQVITLALDDQGARGKTYDIGGPEFISLSDCARAILKACQMTRALVPTSPSYLRALVWAMERVLPRAPLTLHALDYAAANRTAALDSTARMIGLQPSRMEPKLDYLRRRNWGWELLTEQFSWEGAIAA